MLKKKCLEVEKMKLLIIGAGGVGTSAAKIIERRGAEADWAEKVVVSDYDFERAKKVANEICGGGKFIPEQINAMDAESIKEVVKKHGITFAMNACDPRMNATIFDTCLEIGIGYLDCALTLGTEHPEKPYELSNIKLGDYQFAKQKEWEASGQIALCGSGVEPGMADVFAKYAENFSEPEMFDFPGGIGDVEVINVEHEEVVLVPREIDCNRCTFKYGVPADFRKKLLVLKEYGLSDKRTKIKVGDSEITPRDFVCKVIPSPVDATMTMTGKGCAGTWVTGWKDGKYRSVYLYQVADNQECIEKYTTNSVVAQTAVGPVIMMELVAKGIWKDPGAWGPEHFDPDPFVERLAKYEFPAGIREMDSEYADMVNEQKLMDLIEK